MYKLSKYKLWTLSFIAMGVVFAGCSWASGPDMSPMGNAVASEITVFRSPTCGCCSLWIDHMEASGFQVKDEITEEMPKIKRQYGVPVNLRSCHTTVVDGYVLEGHIPSEDVQRLLTEKPDVAGIAVPGMPIGSPGMESGNYVEPYTVFSFQEDSTVATFAEHS